MTAQKNKSLKKVQAECSWDKQKVDNLKQQFVDCPFCEIKYQGYYQQPKSENCPCCFGFKKVPTIMVEKIKQTKEYKEALGNANSGDIRD